ncbi:hypothetical protein JIN85_01645 [Luteolibacter pohnpeiensis]|uniref:Chromosome partitioning protein ParB n=1 Tax=Luteolibacter pohnpeiensis TaxID=454153 RepID=A0A934S2A1_9BACT|nr:hypothetical protein [Luteolibacter pohnpeiensis]MBK1881096.1 hypothetical protein [Luteolibacter pohnpeiensis]
MRPQYHFRPSEQGLLAWDVRNLIKKTIDLTPSEIELTSILEIDEMYWYDSEGDAPTCRSIANHSKLINGADLSFPIILDPDGRVMDGMHRVCKALVLGLEKIDAYKLPEMPDPDFIGISAKDLPYE